MSNALQSAFLNTARKKKVKVNVFVVNGVRLQGRIVSFDAYTILLDDGKRQTLVYKHAISSIVPEGRLEIVFGPINE